MKLNTAVTKWKQIWPSSLCHQSNTASQDYSSERLLFNKVTAVYKVVSTYRLFVLIWTCMAERSP